MIAYWLVVSSVNGRRFTLTAVCHAKCCDALPPNQQNAIYCGLHDNGVTLDIYIYDAGWAVLAARCFKSRLRSSTAFERKSALRDSRGGISPQTVAESARAACKESSLNRGFLCVVFDIYLFSLVGRCE